MSNAPRAFFLGGAMSKSSVNARAAGPWTWIAVAGLVYLLLLGVNLIGGGFKWVSGGTEGAAAIFSFASNPIAGVILGTLATALVQSSSTVTSVIVGLVAGGVPVEIAIPMIMGANMGTTITNTIVSLGNLREGAAFNKSFQAATVHDFFNLYGIIIFLPLELLFHPLQRSADALAHLFMGGSSASIKDLNVVGAITKPLAHLIMSPFTALPASVGGTLTIALGIGFVIAAVIYLGKRLRRVMTGKAKNLVETAIGRNKLTGIASGTLITVLVQSSSTTTSLIVPLAGAGVLTTRQVFPFTMGANIGTCITALLAATAVTGQFQIFALEIALVHLLYNVFGVLVFSFVPWVRDWPIRSAEALGNRAEKHRGWAFGYILLVFFLLPSTVFAGEMAIQGPKLEKPAVTQSEAVQTIQEEEIEVE